MASSSQINARKAFGRNSFGRRARRVLLALVVLIGVPAFILTSCPAYRDGAAGQLAAATEQTQSAARSAALALQL